MNEEVTESKKRKGDARPIWIYLIGTLIAGIIQFALNMLFYGNEPVPQVYDSKQYLLPALIVVIFNLILVIIFIILYQDRLEKDALKLSKKNIIYIIIGAIIFVTINELLAYIMELFNVEMANQNTITLYMASAKIPIVIMTVFLAPFVEEFVFRYSMGTLIKNNTIFIIVSGILFGFAHGAGVATILYILMGMGISYIYVKNDRNILVPISVHIFNNLVSVIETLLILTIAL